MKAMVFAAGLGSRLRDISKATPKCLVEVGGKTMLEWVLLRLAGAGVTEVVINIHHLRERVERFVSDASLPVKVKLSPEDTLLGTGGGLKNAWALLNPTEPFLVHNADIYSDLDLRALLKAHKARSLATLAVMRRETSRALLFSPDGALRGWENGDGKSDLAPSGEPTVERLAFSGIHVMSPRISEYLERDDGNFSIITTYMRGVKSGEEVGAHRIDSAFWVDVGTPEKLDALRRRVGARSEGVS
jgi:NDP-sugar pyrophosphorylase family protein